MQMTKLKVKKGSFTLKGVTWSVGEVFEVDSHTLGLITSRSMKLFFEKYQTMPENAIVTPKKGYEPSWAQVVIIDTPKVESKATVKSTKSNNTKKLTND